MKITEKEIRKLADEQFYNLKEELLEDDRHCVGGSIDEDYEINGEKFNISVDGYWEKSEWYSLIVKDDNGNIILQDDICYYN